MRKPSQLLALVVGILLLGLFGACAGGEEAAAPAPSTAAPQQPPAATTTPSQTTTMPSQVAQQPAAQARPQEGAALVPGGPPFYPAKVAELKGWQYMQQYHQNKLPLWTQAKYGGHAVGLFSAISFTEQSFKYLSVLALNRPSTAGMLLYTDFGRCSWIGRDDFSVCKGEQAHNKAIIIVPGIFQKWEQPSPTTYIFTMRQNVKWPAVPPMARTDRTVTAQDIVFFLDITKKEGIVKQNFAPVKSFEATDRFTVKVTLDAPSADFLRNMAHTSMGIFSKECYDDKACIDAVVAKSPGPFLVKSHEPRSKVVFEKNPEFHMKGLPYLDGLTIINTPDVAGQRAAFQVGQNDFFSSQRIAEAQDILKKVPGSQLHAQGGIGGVSVVFRPQLKGPLADVRVRQAMAMTMDHPALWETGIDGFSLFPTLVSRDYFGEEFYMTLDQAGPNYKFDPVKAKQLLTEAGFANGFATSVVSTSSSGVYYDYMLFLQSQWKKHLNIDLKIQSVDFATYNNQFFGGTWEGLIDTGACWIRSCWGTADDAFAQFVIGSPQNLQKVDDATINDLYQKQRGELDSAKRVKLLWEFDQYELTKLYMLRIGVATTFTMMQPWEMNGASHETMWFTAGPNGPTWLAMHDVNKYPGGRR